MIMVTLLDCIKKNVNCALETSKLEIENIVLTSPFRGGHNIYKENLSDVIKNKIKPLFTIKLNI